MKILYLVHQFYPAHHGGSEKFILQLAQRVQAQGHEVKIITYNNENRRSVPAKVAVDGWRKCIKRFASPLLRQSGLLALRSKLMPPKHEPIQWYEDVYAGVPVFGFCVPQLDTTRFHLADPNLTTFAETLLKRESPDLIHAGYLLRTAEFLYAAQRLGIPYLITLTSFWLICPKHILVNEKEQVCAGPRGGAECKIGCPSYRKKEIATRYADMQRLLDYADAVVAPSHLMTQTFQSEIKTLHPIYIPYGIECQRSSSKPRVYTAGQPLIFFFGGRLVIEKGVELLLTVFRWLPSSQVRLHIYGDGPLRPKVEQAAQADPRIHYGGVYKHEQIGELLEQVDVLIVPSIWHENMPLIMQEAQACAVPTLVSDVGGMTECVTDGVNGFTFRMGDVADLQQKMQMIIDQPEILNRIKENMRNPKPGQYRVTSLEEEARLYLAQYGQILNTPDATVSDRQIR